MLIERIIGSLGDADDDDRGAAVDWLDLSWFDCHQRALRKRTRSGRLVRILLPVLTPLRHRDILLRSENEWVAVNLLPSRVLVGRPGDAEALARVALELGNLHLPTELSGDRLIVLDDGPARALFERYGIVGETEIRRFMPERCSVTSQVTAGGSFSIDSGAAHALSDSHRTEG